MQKYKRIIFVYSMANVTVGRDFQSKIETSLLFSMHVSHKLYKISSSVMHHGNNMGIPCKMLH